MERESQKVKRKEMIVSLRETTQDCARIITSLMSLKGTSLLNNTLVVGRIHKRDRKTCSLLEVVLYSNRNCCSFKGCKSMSTTCTVYAAELRGIELAFQIALDIHTMMTTVCPIVYG